MRPFKRFSATPVKVAAIVTLMVCAGIAAADAAAPDAAHGKVLYDQHCGACHTPGIHRRPQKLPMSRDELRGLVDIFRRQANLGWTPEQVEDVVEYLNRTRYRLPGP